MKRKAIAAAFLFAGSIFAQTAGDPPALAAAEADEPAEILRKLSRRERRERIEKLPVRHQDFVADVEPIIVGAELDTFLVLETDAQRDAFVEEFWRRRDSAGGVPTREFRKTYYARLEIAKERFRRVTTDRARMFLLHGPPARVVRTECQRLLQPLEIWTYDLLPGVGQGIHLLFYKPRDSQDYRIWNPIGGAGALADLLASDSADMGGNEWEARRNLTQSASPYAYINRIQLECKDGNEIMRAITQMVQSRVDLLKLFEPPEIQEEKVQNLLRSLVIANPKAPKLDAEMTVEYPGKAGSRTDVQLTLLVPRAQLQPAEVGESEVYTLDVAGEVLRNGALWEKYRYRFDYPGDVGSEKLPVVINRFLRPDDYLSRVKITDATTGAEVVVEQTISVPDVYVPIEEPPAETAEAASPAAGAIEDPRAKEPKLRIISPGPGVVSGMTMIETMVSGDAIKAVEFWLDGRKMAVRRSPPWVLDFDFGSVPQLRTIRAVALDASGQPITGDEIDVNAGTDPFRVRIASPRVAPHLSGRARVEIDLRIPDDEKLAHLELFWNETRLATLYDAPFVQVVEIPATEGVGYIRAIATLEDDAVPPIEDVVLINSPAYMEELNVHLVELPTTVLVDGKPSSHLTESAFTVFDEGKEVAISKFEHVKNLPLSIGIAIDSSGSMLPRMDDAQKAGAEFVQKTLRRGDKAFLVSFTSEPQLVQKWSTRVADLHAGLAKLRAEETTALYDAIIYSLYNFQGIRGQKALVVISDGKDTASKFTWDNALEYARRTGVPIYAIAIGLKGNEVDVRYKLTRLCTETGGTAFYIDQARDLQRIYDAIQSELRSQYILGFYPAPDVKPGSRWREVEVRATGGKARTIRGYFP